MAYATVTEFQNYLDGDPLPAHPERLLDRASARVDEMLRGAWYETESDNITPTNAIYAAAIKKATILQAQYMGIVGDETGAKGRFSSMSTGTVSWSRATSRAGGIQDDRYAPEAVTEIQNAGFVYTVGRA